MKKIHKIVAIAIVILLILVFATLKIAPIFIKDYIVNHSKDYIGRNITIENIQFNPITFTVQVENLSLLEQNNSNPFVSFKEFRINLDPLKIITGTAAVSEIYLKELYVHVSQKGNSFNFSDILDFVNAKHANKDSAFVDSIKNDSTNVINAAEIASKLPFDISIENIVFEKGNIIYEDSNVESKIHIQDFNINIPAVYLSNKITDVSVDLKFAQGGNLNVKINMNAATNDFNININLNEFALASGKPYLKKFIQYKDFKGSLSSALLISGNLNDILSSDIKGTVFLDSILLTETNDKTIGVNRINIGIAEANLNKNKFIIDSIIVDGAFAHLDLYKEGTTNIHTLLEPIMKPNPKDSAIISAADSTIKNEGSTKKLNAIINKLYVHNTKVNANDFSLVKPFHYTVNTITINGSNINFNSPCVINIAAAFPEGGSVNIKYKGVINNFGTMDAYISLKNLALKHFSNYSLHYTGYPISAGTMAFASENKITNFNLESQNTIDIYNIDVDDKNESIDPQFMVPMKIGLYIMKDKDEKIQFNIPVKGNIKDPQFSIVKIVWQTVMNLIVKVALSPLNAVKNIATSGANAVGLNLGDNDEIYIDPLSKTFSSEQYAKAKKMTEVLVKDPKLIITFTQYYNPNKLIEDYKTRKLKTEFYKQKEGKSILNEIDEHAILEIKESDEEFKSYAKEYEKTIDENSIRNELANFAEIRNQDIFNVLKQQTGVTPKNLKVKTAKALAKHKGKAMYKITIDVQ